MSFAEVLGRLIITKWALIFSAFVAFAPWVLTGSDLALLLGLAFGFGLFVVLVRRIW